MTFEQALIQAGNESGWQFTPEQLQAFKVYNDLLLSWNEKINLTAITDVAEIAVKHMIDSLSCYQQAMFPDGCSVIDVGTGAGFPGLPLKIVYPDIRLTLLDSLNKRLLFLQEVVSSLGLETVEFMHARAEDAGQKAGSRESFQVALSRAVARLDVLAELCLPLVKVGGYFIALKGARYREELTEAEAAIKKLGGKVAAVRPVNLPSLSDSRAVIYIAKDHPTPKEFPRRPGLPEKKPLGGRGNNAAAPN
jgi:16S rRNA (guanine527-N7)-methyltransferase